MATRTQQRLIAILTPLALGAVIITVTYYILKKNPSEAATIQHWKDMIAKEDRRTEKGLDAYSRHSKKRDKPKTAYVKPKPRDPIDWSPKKIRALKAADTKAFADQMMTILAGGTRDEAWKAAANLAVLEKYARPALQKGFTHDKAKVRYFSVRAVSLMNDSPVPLDAMKPLATDADLQVRCALARALGDRLTSLRKNDGRMAQVRRILAALLDDRESVVRGAVASVLEEIRLEAMAGPLLKALDRKPISREEQHRICSALESTFSFNVGIEYQPAPSLPADLERRVQRWREWGQQRKGQKKTLKGGATADAEGVD